MATAERSSREREQYNRGLERDSYRRILLHTRVHYGPLSAERLKKLMAAADDVDVLEIGSSSWFRFIHQHNIKPRSLTCINISEAELDIGIKRAQQLDRVINFRIMDAHQLDFPNDYFDCVFGGHILHHLELETAISEIHRVLKPSGFAIFVEPFDNNPIGKVVRFLTPKARTVDEEPFRFKHLAVLRTRFNLDIYYEQLISVPVGVLSYMLRLKPDNPLTRWAFGFDEWLIRRVPAIGPYYRAGMIVMSPK